MTARQFPYILRDPAERQVSLAPRLPFRLATSHAEDVLALVDSGAALNGLPYSAGTRSGLNWASEKFIIQLTGNLSMVEAKAVVVPALIADFPVVRLAFGWVKTDDMSVILGQVNFFQEFDVCFFRSREVFEVRPRS